MGDYWKNQPRVPKGNQNGGQFMSIERRFNITDDIDINFSMRRAQEKKNGEKLSVAKDEYAIISSEVMRKRAECIRHHKKLKGVVGIYTAKFFYCVRVTRDHFFVVSSIDIESKREELREWKKEKKD